MQIQDRTPNWVEAPKRQKNTNSEKQWISQDAKHCCGRFAETFGIQVLVPVFVGEARRDGEGKYPWRRAQGKGEGLKFGLGDVASNGSRQQKRRIGCRPLDRLKPPCESKWLPLLDH